MKQLKNCRVCVGTRETLLKAEGKVRDFLALLSAIAVVLVVANEFLTHEAKLPLLSLTWGEAQAWLRGIIWFSFASYCVTYGLVAKNKLEYLRTHFLELLVCFTWLPNYHSVVFHHFTDLLSVATLQLVGSLAHAWRVARWNIRRFNTHPIVVTGSAALALVVTASAVLNQVEPQTFPSVWDAAWYCLSTITTVGYGDLVPKTAMGRAVGAVVMLGGISLAGVFIGLMTEFVRKRLVKASEKGRVLSPLIPGMTTHEDDSEPTQRQILDELRTNNRLLSELVEELRKANERKPDEKSGS